MTIETEVVLRRPVPASHAPELERRIFFVSPEISAFRLVVADGMVNGLRVVTSAVPDRAQLAEKLNSLVEGDVSAPPVLPAKVVWASPHRLRPRPEVYPELAAAGMVSECGEGQVALGEPLISLLAGVDRRLRQLVVAAFDAVEYRYPTLIPTRVLTAAGYPAAFPQHLMAVTRLHEDIDVYREFQESYRQAGVVDRSFLQHCRNVDYCLPPTMCFHTFGQYGGRVLPPAGPHVVTSSGKSFRHESRYARTLERLWDFTIRETVFLGSRSEVLDCRDRLMQLVFAFVTELGLAGRCEVANDPFFVGTDVGMKAWSQRTLELKYELRLPLTEDRDLAVGSFNFHDDFFGRGFDITRADLGPVISGCAGFGLERFVYALLCQHGTDPTGWPRSMRELGQRC